MACSWRPPQGGTRSPQWGEGKHLYGVIRKEKERDFGFTGIGERQDKVYTIHHQGLAAVVSDSPPIDCRLIPQEAVVTVIEDSITCPTCGGSGITMAPLPVACPTCKGQGIVAQREGS